MSDWAINVAALPENRARLDMVLEHPTFGPITVRVSLESAEARRLSDALLEATGDARMRVLPNATRLAPLED